MNDEEERCEECGSENILDAVYFGKMAKLCKNCALTNGAVILKKPTIEQLNRAERDVSLQGRVKAWRKERDGVSEANIDTLRKRKHEIEKKEAIRREELIKKGHEPGIIDFHSKQVTIRDLKKIREQKQKTAGPMPLPFPEPKPPRLENPDDGIEITEFMQEVQRVKEEEQLEQEIVVPFPIGDAVEGVEEATEDTAIIEKEIGEKGEKNTEETGTAEISMD